MNLNFDTKDNLKFLIKKIFLYLIYLLQHQTGLIIVVYRTAQVRQNYLVFDLYLPLHTTYMTINEDN